MKQDIAERLDRNPHARELGNKSRIKSVKDNQLEESDDKCFREDVKVRFKENHQIAF